LIQGVPNLREIVDHFPGLFLMKGLGVIPLPHVHGVVKEILFWCMAHQLTKKKPGIESMGENNPPPALSILASLTVTLALLRSLPGYFTNFE